MCRIAVVFDSSLQGLAGGFVALEKSQGGDGNGVAWATGGAWKVRKGEKMPAGSCACPAGGKPDVLFFHTRATSKGATNDANTQPFHVGETVFCHNGHVADTSYSSALALSGLSGGIADDWSDSRRLAHLLDKAPNMEAAIEFLKCVGRHDVFVVARGHKLAIVALKSFYALSSPAGYHAMASERVDAWTFEGATWKEFEGVVTFDSQSRELVLPKMKAPGQLFSDFTARDFTGECETRDVRRRRKYGDESSSLFT